MGAFFSSRECIAPCAATLSRVVTVSESNPGQSIKSHGSCLAHMFFAAQQELAAIATMVEIIEWRRQDVGVFVRVRAVGRVAIEDISQIEPFFVVKAKEVHDQPGDEETVAALVAEVRELRAECVSCPGILPPDSFLSSCAAFGGQPRHARSH